MTTLQIIATIIIAWALAAMAVCAFVRGGKRSEWALPRSDFDDSDEAGGGRL
jgi:hypothetical protein